MCRWWIGYKVSTIQTIDTSDLGKKAEQNTKIAEIKKKIPDHDNYSSTPDCNKLTKQNFSKILKQWYCCFL